MAPRAPGLQATLLLLFLCSTVFGVELAGGQARKVSRPVLAHLQTPVAAISAGCFLLSYLQTTCDTALVLDPAVRCAG